MTARRWLDEQLACFSPEERTADLEASLRRTYGYQMREVDDVIASLPFLYRVWFRWRTRRLRRFGA